MEYPLGNAFAKSNSSVPVAMVDDSGRRWGSPTRIGLGQEKVTYT